MSLDAIIIAVGSFVAGDGLTLAVTLYLQLLH
jgi:hypothetical protein